MPIWAQATGLERKSQTPLLTVFRSFQWRLQASRQSLRSRSGKTSSPFIRENLKNGKNTEIRGVEPESCPSLTRGEYRYNFGDTVGMTPLMKMHTLGRDSASDPIHAGGLRYQGMAPLISHVYELGLMDAVVMAQLDCFAAGVQFARTEGIVPAPEPTHALAEIIRQTKECKETGEEKVLLTALCHHSHFDLAAYDAFLGGTMIDHELSDASIQAAMETVPKI